MKPFLIVLLLAGCTKGQLAGDIDAKDGFDVLLMECFGWCRTSKSEAIGDINTTRKQKRSVGQ